MRYTCFKCLKQFRTFELLWNHLKLCHFITTKSRTKIICSQAQCKNIYYNGYSYKRHLQNDHTQLQEEPENYHQEAGNIEMQAIDNEDIFDDGHNVQVRLHDDVPRTAEDVKEKFQTATVSYICSLKDSVIPSLTVQNVIKTTGEFIDSVVETIQEASNPIIQDLHNNTFPSDEKVQQFKTVLNAVKDPIASSNFATQSQQKRYCIDVGTLIEPQEIELGTIHKGKLNVKTGRTEEKEIKETFQYVPIGRSLKLLLEQPGYFTSIIQEHEQNSEPNILQSYRDGSYYREQTAEHNDGGIVIDVTLYNDDFETVNPLGSKKGKHKLLGVYMSIISLPAKYQSRLENIVLVALCKSAYVSKYGLNAVLEPIVTDLEYLFTNGLEVDIDNVFHGYVKPKLFQAVGDNLALNTVLGFTTSFSANYFCRFCKTKKVDTHQQVEEDETSLRTQNSIDDDIARANLSDTGLHRSSKLNNLTYYHVADNLAPDIMHDFHEGLLAIELKLLIAELVSQRRFQLHELNARIQSFSYGFTEQSNRPSCILAGQLTNPFGASGQHASQMQCLAVNFPLLIGDKVPADSQFWELYTLLLEIFRIVSAPSVSIDGTYYLQGKIRDHHLLYLRLFPEHRLIPKHHNLVHYPRAIRRLGPLLQFSSIRHEAKHYPLKQWANVSHNYKNIAKTLAYRHQEKVAYSMLQEKDIDTKSVVIHDQEVVEVSALQNDDDICDLLHCSPETEIVVCGNVSIYGYKYRPNTMLLSEWIEQPMFVMIKHIILSGSQVRFIVQLWETEDFDDHYQAYKVSTDEAAHLQIKDHKDLCDYRPVHAVENYSLGDNSMYIPTRFELI